MKITKESMYALLIGLIIGIGFIASFNIYQFNQIKDTQTEMRSVSIKAINVPLSTETSTSSSKGTKTETLNIIPTGIPNIYGTELGISFDDVNANDPAKADSTIRKLGTLDQQITLLPTEKERYISILYTLENGISCEYCCGTRSIIFENGEAACGCAHSFAMRGLAKYLLQNHADEYADKEILEELGKWKTLFFPGKMAFKAQVLEEKGIEMNYINLASNKYRGIENGNA